MIFQAELPEARALLAGWISWARRSRIPAFVRLAKTIIRFQDLILNAVEHGLPMPDPRPVAVGTALAGGPPRRSQRAGLPHWALALGSGGKAHLREGMRHAGGW
jgi:hypothetical protein